MIKILLIFEQSCYNFHSHFSVCSNGHLLVKDQLFGVVQNRYYTCIKCKRYNICQPSCYCWKCKEGGCFACCKEENDEDLGKKDFDC